MGAEDEELAEELDSVTAIYGEDIVERIGERMLIVNIYTEHDAAEIMCKVEFTFPLKYPRVWPIVKVDVPAEAMRVEGRRAEERVREQFFACGSGRDCADNGVGHIVKEQEPRAIVYDIVEWLRNDDALIASCERRRARPSSESSHADGADTDEMQQCSSLSRCFVHGDKRTDRKSVFQAHLARVESEADVSRLMDALLMGNKRVREATHNIMAYRIGDVHGDYDDDGETAAGSRLLHLLKSARVVGVLVVVSRWYGGIHLGPDRFRHISNAARDLLEQNGYIQSSTHTKR